LPAAPSWLAVAMQMGGLDLLEIAEAALAGRRDAALSLR
jgi:hypothetical protein